MATPLTVCVAVAGRHVEAIGFLNILLGDEPALPKGVRYYQRLLAKDEIEAMQILRLSTSEVGLANTYENVVITGLKIAERDARRGWLAPEKFRDVLALLRQQITRLSEEDRAANTIRQAKGKDPVGGNACEIPTPQSPQPLPFKSRKDKSRLWRRIVERRRRVERAAHALWSFDIGRKPDSLPATFSLPKDVHPKVLILPARDEPDELAGLMLSHVLASAGYSVTVPSIALLAQEMVNEVTKIRPDLVVVSATPPSAVAHARYLLKRLAGAGVVRTPATASTPLPTPSPSSGRASTNANLPAASRPKNPSTWPTPSAAPPNASANSPPA